MRPSSLAMLGGEVGLGKLDSLEQRRFIEAYACLRSRLRQFARSGKVPFRLPVITAQVLVESYLLQACHAVFERRLLIEIPEKARILETRPQHARIAVPDDGCAVLIGLSIQHGEKMRRQLAARILYGE